MTFRDAPARSVPVRCAVGVVGPPVLAREGYRSPVRGIASHAGARGAAAALSGMWEAVMSTRPSIVRAVAALLALGWVWVLLRVAAHPGPAGPLEQGIAAGGWTLSVLPVQASPRRAAEPRTRSVPPAGAPVPAGPLPTPRGPLRDRTAPGGTWPDGTVARGRGAARPAPAPGAPGPAGGVAAAAGGGAGVGRVSRAVRRPPTGATAVSALAGSGRGGGRSGGAAGGQVRPGGAGPRWHDGHQ